MEDIEAIERSADVLAADPLYVLSTAGQELFHSNMLAWLMNVHPDACEPLWALFSMYVHGPGERQIVVHRELHNLDLYVETGMGGHRLALENKLHALPRKEQLEEYTAKLETGPDGSPAKLAGTRCVLLSLINPVEALPYPWWHVPYDGLIGAIEQVARRVPAGFDQDLANHYCTLVRRLVALREALSSGTDPDAPWALDPALRARLQERRLLALAEKLRATALAQRVARELGDDVPITRSLSNTHGLIDQFVPGPRGRHFGWQFQAGQLRLVVITAKRDPSARPRREAIVESEHLDYFDFDRAGAGHLAPYAGKKPWLGYEPNFVYRYRPVAPAATWSECVQFCVGAGRWARAYADGAPAVSTQQLASGSLDNR